MADVEIFWFRNDRRLTDQPALTAAAEAGRTVVPVFLWSPEEEGDWSPGAARNWWLHHSLTSLKNDLADHGVSLVIRRGPAEETLRTLINETGATRLSFNAHFEPAIRKRDRAIAESLKSDGVEVKSFNGLLLHHPESLKTGSGGPYRVFTPFWRALRERIEIAEPLPTAEITAYDGSLDSLCVEELGLLPKIAWDGGFAEAWSPGETAARERLQTFLESSVADYDDLRNRPDIDGTSRLSPYLHHGELSPRTVYHVTQAFVEEHPTADDGADTFLSEIGWREFAYHVLYHFPETTDEPLQEKFQRMPWKTDADGQERWERGLTGYPIVDAGMRQLWATGWMHNRVRMIVGSFLCKDQLLSWQVGAAWFWDTLVDADLASNSLGWQWVGGCGADAAPYFRIFNPMTQGEKFDPEGDYIRQWVPELAELPKKYLNKPWEAPAIVLQGAGVTLGETYPEPIVDHSIARNEALEALKQTKL